MRIKALIVVAACAYSFQAAAQIQCGSQPQEVSPDIQQRLQADAEGKAQVFTKLLGDVNLKGKVDVSKREIYQKYRDIDKSQIDRYMIWVSCQNIMLDKALNAVEKNRLWIEIYRELRSSPGAGNSPAPPDEDQPARQTENDRTKVNAFTLTTPSQEVKPGIRTWTRLAGEKWSEEYPDGTKTISNIVKRINQGGCDGSVISSNLDQNFQGFIPDKGCENMVFLFRRLPARNWTSYVHLENVR